MRIQVGDINNIILYLIFVFNFVANWSKISNKFLIVTFVIFITYNE